jgi:hypothetical protein
MSFHELALRLQAWFEAMWNYPFSGTVLTIVLSLVTLNLVMLALMLIFVWIDNRRWRSRY